MGKTLFQMSRVRSPTDAEISASGTSAGVLSSTQVRGTDTMEVRNPLDRENPIKFRTSSVTGHVTTREDAGRCDSYRDLCHNATVLAQAL